MEDDSLELGLPCIPEGTRSFGMCIIGMIAIQHPTEERKWCATHETRGWFMPAGRVDYGEGIDTGAKREALEEAGVHVELIDLIRIDFLHCGDFVRFLASYRASLCNENDQLRDESQADDEIIKAAWVDPSELEDGRPVRSLDMVELFQFINRSKGSSRVPANFIQCVDGHPIDHKRVETETVLSVSIMIFSEDLRQILLFPNQSSGYEFLHVYMNDKNTFGGLVKSSEEFQACGEDSSIVGLACLRYAPPHDQFENRKVGHMNVVVVSTVKRFSKELGNAKLFRVRHLLRNADILSLPNLNLLERVCNYQIYPTAVIQP